MTMKTTQARSLLLTCSLAAFAASGVFAKSAEDKIEKMDTNNDGLISRAEHRECAQRMFVKLDADNDGAVTGTELATEKETPHNDMKRDDMGRHQQFGEDKFKMLDMDKDGRVTLAEVTSGCETMFEKMDANGDGALSKEEIEAAKKMKMETHD